MCVRVACASIIWCFMILNCYFLERGTYHCCISRTWWPRNSWLSGIVWLRLSPNMANSLPATRWRIQLKSAWIVHRYHMLAIMALFHISRNLQWKALRVCTFVWPGAVLEILLSSFQTARLSWTFAVRVRWDLRAKFPVTLQHKFFRRSPIFLRCDQKKGSSLHFLSFESKQRPLNTTIQPAVYASWNIVAEKGRTHRWGKIVSGFWKPHSKNAPELLLVLHLVIFPHITWSFLARNCKIYCISNPLCVYSSYLWQNTETIKRNLWVFAQLVTNVTFYEVKISYNSVQRRIAINF